MSRSDEELIVAMAGGDREAFAEIYRRRRPDVYRFAAHMTGDPAADACSCNSTCDATCSECMYFHAGAVMQLVSLTLSSAIFAFSPPEGSLQHHPSRNFRPPPTPLA